MARRLFAYQVRDSCPEIVLPNKSVSQHQFQNCMFEGLNVKGACFHLPPAYICIGVYRPSPNCLPYIMCNTSYRLSLLLQGAADTTQTPRASQGSRRGSLEEQREGKSHPESSSRTSELMDVHQQQGQDISLKAKHSLGAATGVVPHSQQGTDRISLKAMHSSGTAEGASHTQQGEEEGQHCFSLEAISSLGAALGTRGLQLSVLTLSFLDLGDAAVRLLCQGLIKYVMSCRDISVGLHAHVNLDLLVSASFSVQVNLAPV